MATHQGPAEPNQYRHGLAVFLELEPHGRFPVTQGVQAVLGRLERGYLGVVNEVLLLGFPRALVEALGRGWRAINFVPAGYEVRSASLRDWQLLQLLAHAPVGTDADLGGHGDRLLGGADAFLVGGQRIDGGAHVADLVE